MNETKAKTAVDSDAAELVSRVRIRREIMRPAYETEIDSVNWFAARQSLAIAAHDAHV